MKFILYRSVLCVSARYGLYGKRLTFPAEKYRSFIFLACRSVLLIIQGNILLFFVFLGDFKTIISHFSSILVAYFRKQTWHFESELVFPGNIRWAEIKWCKSTCPASDIRSRIFLLICRHFKSFFCVNCLYIMFSFRKTGQTLRRNELF